MAELGEAKVPAGPVLRPSEALAHPQVAATGLVDAMDYPGGFGSAPVVRTPIMLSASAKAKPVAAPRLGADSDAILAEIGYDAAAISALRAENII
nr:CoA transferase [Sphingopyxis sp. PET50]